jgi:hypothetical protein
VEIAMNHHQKLRREIAELLGYKLRRDKKGWTMVCPASSLFPNGRQQFLETHEILNSYAGSGQITVDDVWEFALGCGHDDYSWGERLLIPDWVTDLETALCALGRYNNNAWEMEKIIGDQGEARYRFELKVTKPLVGFSDRFAAEAVCAVLLAVLKTKMRNK